MRSVKQRKRMRKAKRYRVTWGTKAKKATNKTTLFSEPQNRLHAWPEK